MGQASDIALWGALAFGFAAVAIVTTLLVTRGVKSFFHRRLHRRVEQVQQILQRHRADSFAQVDRLLFELGNVRDYEAIEQALNGLLESDSAHDGPGLLKIYQGLGLVDRYSSELGQATQWSKRAAAAKALGQLGVVDAIPGLVAAMRDAHEDETVKLAAARALAMMRAESAIPLLIEQLGQPSDWASPRLAELLVGFGERARPALREALGDESRSNARIWAAQILGRLGDSSDVPRLLNRLQDRSERVRISVAEALGRLAEQTAIPDLTRLALRDPLPTVRAEAARALGAIGDPSVIGELVLLLDANDYWTRLRAVEAIERLHPEDTYPLERALGDDSEMVRAEAARALERLGVLERWLEKLDCNDPQEVETALDKLVKCGRAGGVESLLTCIESDNLRVRARICNVLARIADPQAVPGVVQLLEDPMWPVRAQAASALGQLRPENAADLLLPLLSDAEEMVRIAAIGAIQRIGVPNIQERLPALLELYRQGNAEARSSVIDSIEQVPTEAVLDLLLQSLNDPNAEVRLHGLRQVAERPSEAWTPTLIRRLSDADARVRKSAARALTDVDAGDALAAIAECLTTEDEEFRETLTTVLARQGTTAVLDLLGRSRKSEKRIALALALGKTADRASLPRLTKLARDRQSEVRVAVASALGNIRDDRSREVIAELLHDPSESVRGRALDSLGRLGLPESVPLALALLDDPQQEVRNRAAIVLGALGGERAEQGLERLLAGEQDLPARAHAIVACGLLGSARAREIALGGLVDERFRPEIDRILACESVDVVRRFRANLSLDDEELDESLSDESLRGHYLERLRNSHDVAARLDALRALRTVAGERQIETLINVVSSDPSPEVRRLSLQFLAPHVSQQPVAEAMRRALRDPLPMVQEAAVEGLAQACDPSHNEVLLRCSAVSDESLAATIERALIAANEKRVGDLIDEVMGYADEGVLAIGARVLGSIGDPRAHRLLTRWTQSGGKPLRAAAIASLGALGTLEAKQTLIECLDDPCELIRAAAAEALTRLPLVGLATVLHRLTKDPSVRVRSSFALRLGHSRDVAAIDLLAELVSDPDDQVRLATLQSLLLLGTDASVGKFIEAFEGQLPDLQQSLRELTVDPELTCRLCEMVTAHRSPPARARALEAIGLLRARPLEALTAALADPEPDVRIAAASVCGAVDDPALTAAVEKLLADPVDRVRDAVRKNRFKVVPDTRSR